jgi:glycogen debranching enzyme
MNTPDMLREAERILRLNDKGTYTVPTHGLYPFQWNWDSCLTALGQFHLNPDRAWTELETLVAHQWPDGMVPHIVFHERDDGYFPGPDVWQTQRPTPTSGITQPPVLGMVLEKLYQRSGQDASVQSRCRALLAAAVRWHDWFYRCRDPRGTGLVALLHPWESGRDNSCDWDEALAAVSTQGISPYQRRDTTHVDASQRPTQFEYDRYVALLEGFRRLKWDNRLLHDASPFQVVDPGFNAILIHSEQALARLAEILGEARLSQRLHARADQSVQAMDSLWSDDLGQYVGLNRRTGQPVRSASVGGLLPVLVLPAGHVHVQHLCDRLNDWLRQAPYGVCSMDPADPRFDGHRYWRGPSWLIVNFLLMTGLRQCGQALLAQRLQQVSLQCIETGGCSEYYHPMTGQALGGGTFTWTAAMVIEFLTRSDLPAALTP